MRHAPRYRIAASIEQVCQLLKLSQANVLRRAGLPPDLCAHPDSTVDAATYFRVWDAVRAESKQTDLAVKLGKTYAHGPFSSPIFAFSSSDNIEAGLTRLADYKPLLGPVRISVARVEDAVSVTFYSADPDAPIAQSLALFELSYIVECARIFTGEHIVPIFIGTPHADHATPDLIDHLGAAVTGAAETQLVFSLEDARRPLITRNETLWEAWNPACASVWPNRRPIARCGAG